MIRSRRRMLPNQRMQPTGRKGAHLRSGASSREDEAEQRIVRARARSPAADAQVVRRMPMRISEPSMTLSQEELSRICRIADAHGGYSGPSLGKSLAQVVAEAGYSELRPRLKSEDLEAYFRNHPDLIQQWAFYSQDKRTSDGWSFQPGATSSTVGFVGSSPSSRAEQFASAAAGCAEFVIRELDGVIGRASARR